MFSCEIDVTGMDILANNHVFVGWKWYWDIACSHSHEDSCDSNNDSNNDSDDIIDNALQRTHTVVFKCIGTTKEESYQEVLAKSNRRLRNGENVPVRLTPEPSNPVNSKAIAFECEIDGHWERIGYVVNEVLEEVHIAINNEKIEGVRFKWIKFITDWYGSQRFVFQNLETGVKLL